MHNDELHRTPPMAQGRFSMQELWEIHPCPYNIDTRGAQAVGVQPSTLCGES